MVTDRAAWHDCLEVKSSCSNSRDEPNGLVFEMQKTLKRPTPVILLPIPFVVDNLECVAVFFS